jgi:hypothetical protein
MEHITYNNFGGCALEPPIKGFTGLTSKSSCMVLEGIKGDDTWSHHRDCINVKQILKGSITIRS